MKSIITVLLCFFSLGTLGLSFSGKIVGIPEEVIELQQNTPSNNYNVLNGLNYQSRFTISLIPLKTQVNNEILYTNLNKDYEFSFDQLISDNEYQLVVNSHDFNLEEDRFRVVVENVQEEEGTIIRAYKERLFKESYNSSTEAVVNNERPLSIKITSVKQYYEQRLGSLWDMVLNSPFGFIFANTMYTITAGICVALMIAPYALQYIAPDLAAELNGEPSNTEVIPANDMSPKVAPEVITGNVQGQKSSGSVAGNAIQNARQRK